MRPSLLRVSLKAVVKHGRLVLDHPADLPDGTVLELVVDDETATMSASELEELNIRLEASARSLDAGKGLPADAVLDALDRKRS